MKLFGSFVGAAVMAGAGLAYYVYQRKVRSGASYLDVIKQLPGDVQRVSADARRRAGEAVEQGKAAARRRDEELTLQLKAAGSRPAAAPGAAAPVVVPAPAPAFVPQPAPTTTAAPAPAESGPATV